ncbi:MAG: hypothetical protein Kapaf2KO_17130 [Candidatus Kapaibacteriales bacterium]
MRYIDIGEYGRFALMIGILNWVFSLVDSYALQGIIRFASDKETNSKVASVALNIFQRSTLFLLVLSIGISSILVFLGVLDGWLLFTFYLAMASIANAPRIFLLKIFQREMDFKNIAIGNLILYATFIGSLIFFGTQGSWISAENMALLFGISAILSSIYSFIFGRKYVDLANGDDKKDNYRKYSVPVTLQAVCISSVKQLDSIILKLFTGYDTIGFYNLAKSIFKFFEEGAMGAAMLFNPAIVKRYSLGDSYGAKVLIEKVFAYTTIVFIGAIIFIWSGLIEWPLSYLLEGDKLTESVVFLKYLSLSGLFLPLYVLSFAMNANGKEKELLKSMAVASISAFVYFIVSGLFFEEMYYPVGFLVFYGLIGMNTFLYLKSSSDFGLLSIFRIFSDIKGLISNKTN